MYTPGVSMLFKMDLKKPENGMLWQEESHTQCQKLPTLCKQTCILQVALGVSIETLHLVDGLHMISPWLCAAPVNKAPVSSQLSQHSALGL